MEALTLKDLAQLAGVHASTVARVLNGDPQQRVRPEVRDRIVSLARTHGYQPNGVARALRLKRSRVIGTMIPDISNPFFAAMFRGIEDTLAQQDFSVILANTDDDPRREQRGMTMLRERQVDGLILATARRDDPAIAGLAADRYPYVLVNRHTDPLEANVVVPDDYNGAASAVDHLVALGHRRIAHIAGAAEVSTGNNRRRGYADALARHGLPVDPALIVDGTFREAGGYAAMGTLLTRRPLPTAVFAVNDLAAMGALRATRQAGLDVPRDISIIGFNDLPVVAQMSPALTTLHVPLHAMGVAAAARLLARLTGTEQPDQPVVMPVELICRESTGPVAARQELAGCGRPPRTGAGEHREGG
ncbi:MAG TPA: LacI family DNA-binding transcriptional regulator [Chloroflexota bacterium]|nr:LacI family DNA-binding transcriptional regulator [Chloroflexota bacterium]